MPSTTIVNYHPWKRFFARHIDLFSCCIIVYALTLIIAPSFHPKMGVKTYILILFIWTLSEPIIIRMFGSTPGKSIYGIKVLTIDDQKPSLLQLYKRSFTIWLFGFLGGLPIIHYIGFRIAKIQLTKTGVTAWDKNKFKVIHSKFNKGNIFSLIITVVGLGIILTCACAHAILHYNKEYPNPVAFNKQIISENKMISTQPKNNNPNRLQLTAVSFFNNTKISHYTFNAKKSDIADMSDFASVIKKSALGVSCETADKPYATLTKGYDLVAIIVDKNNEHLLTFSLHPSDCRKL